MSFAKNGKVLIRKKEVIICGEKISLTLSIFPILRPAKTITRVPGSMPIWLRM